MCRHWPGALGPVMLRGELRQRLGLGLRLRCSCIGKEVSVCTVRAATKDSRMVHTAYAMTTVLKHKSFGHYSWQQRLRNRATSPNSVCQYEARTVLPSARRRPRQPRGPGVLRPPSSFHRTSHLNKKSELQPTHTSRLPPVDPHAPRAHAHAHAHADAPARIGSFVVRARAPATSGFELGLTKRAWLVGALAQRPASAAAALHPSSTARGSESDVHRCDSPTARVNLHRECEA